MPFPLKSDTNTFFGVDENESSVDCTERERVESVVIRWHFRKLFGEFSSTIISLTPSLFRSVIEYGGISSVTDIRPIPRMLSLVNVAGVLLLP